MPIKLNHTTPEQVTASYHVVRGANADFIDNQAKITVETYLSKSAFTGGATPVQTRRRTVSGNAYNNYFGRSVLQKKGKDPVTQAQKYLVNATAEWNSGTIVAPPNQG